MATHKTGVWIDDATGEVVYAPPNRGTQIVAKGGAISATAKARLAALGVDDQGEAAGTESGLVQPLEAAVESDDVETAVEPPRPRSKKKSRTKTTG